MPHFTSAELQNDAPLPATVDTLVVGAGMAGLYATWRIVDHDLQASIAIFESSDRTGGRLDSDLIHFQDGAVVKEEEGGMRFTLTEMPNLMSLLLIFGLDKEIVPFPMGPSGSNRLYFRGQSFTNTEGAQNDFAIWDHLYNLAPPEQGIDPSNIINTVFARILAVNPQFDGNATHDPAFWQSFRLDCQWNGVLLKDWTLWNLFADMGYSNECIVLQYGLAGFNGTYLSQMNAGEAFQLLEDFTGIPDFKTLENGYSTLPNALVTAIGSDKIFLRTRLESIDQKTDDGYVVTYTTHDAQGRASTGTLTARKVILGLPRLALEQLFLKSNALNTLPQEQADHLWNTLQTTTNQPLAKINLYYDQAWWGNNATGQPSVEYGANFTDLPMGTVYPFYALDEENFAALEYELWLQEHGKAVPDDLAGELARIDQKKYGLPAALTIYCDFLNINFWKALQSNGRPFDSAMQSEYSSRTPQTIFPASRRVVEIATEYFKELFNTNYVPQPVLTSARIWEGSTQFDVLPSQRFGYGVHQWGLHADDSKVIPFLTEPLPGLYTCGEAYSDYQGWVEGALRSTNLVLEKGFGLQRINEVYAHQHGIGPSEAAQKAYAKNAAALIRKYIYPGFLGQQEVELAAAQGRRKRRSFGLSLSDFEQD